MARLLGPRAHVEVRGILNELEAWEGAMSLELISSVRVTSVEMIPLSYYCTGGLAVLVDFIECPIPCLSCPWGGNLNRRNARALALRLDELSYLASRYDPDLIFFHGGEPLLKGDLLGVAKRLKAELGARIGVKVNLAAFQQSLSLLSEALELFDAVLLEVVLAPSISAFKELRAAAELARLYGTHKEVLLTVFDGVEGPQLEEALGTLPPMVPVNIVFIGSVGARGKVELVDALRKRGSLIQAPFEELMDAASSLCPSCRRPVILRTSATLVKVLLDGEGRCAFCGTRVISALSKRHPNKLIKRPLNVLVY